MSLEPADETRLRCASEDHMFRLLADVPRFVSPRNYADSFGHQWSAFRTMQLDSYSGTALSRDRFREVTQWTRKDLAGALVLDAGAGAGRFTEIALDEGARTVAVDLSGAVVACRQNLGERFGDRLCVVQASILDLPFAPQTFDKVFCIGVMQHTPAPLATVRALTRMVKPGGELVIWGYELNWKSFVGCNAWKYGLRVLTRLMDFHTIYLLSFVLTVALWPLWFPLMYMGRFGTVLLTLMPVAAKNYVGKGFKPGLCFKNVLLDTVDWYSPYHDKPQNFSAVVRVLRKQGFGKIVRTTSGIGIRAFRERP